MRGITSTIVALALLAGCTTREVFDRDGHLLERATSLGATAPKPSGDAFRVSIRGFGWVGFAGGYTLGYTHQTYTALADCQVVLVRPSPETAAAVTAALGSKPCETED